MISLVVMRLGRREHLSLSVALFVVGLSAACGAQSQTGDTADEAPAKPSVVRLVQGPGSQALELLENASKALPEALLGFADWASINNRLVDQAERRLYGQLPREELEINSKDPLAEVAIKTTLQNLPLLLARSATSTNLLFQRTRKALRAGNRLMERDSAEFKRWQGTQLKGLEESALEVQVTEFVQARSLQLNISSEVESDDSADPSSPAQTAIFTVAATLSPARRWTGERWERWGSVSLEEFKVAIKLPKDWKRESLFRDRLFNAKVISGFGVQPVDRMVWPPTPLREQYPLLDLLSDQDDKACFEALQRVAKSGDAEGQFLLGRAYDRGDGTVANPALAAKWWEESARHGFAPGLFAAAETCLNGNGRTSDPKQGLQYLEKAAGLGNPRALTLLGVREMSSNTSNQSSATGLARIQKAAAAGDPVGLLFLFKAYVLGTGVPKDPARGEQLLRASAAWGHPTAMLTLGRLYLSRGEKREAWPWFYLAAKYNTTLCGKDYEAVKKEAVAEVLTLRKELSETDLESAHRDGTALEAIYRPLWNR